RYEDLDEGELAEVLEITEENDVDKDEEDEEDDDEDGDKGIEENTDDTKVKDISRRRINCLKAVLKKPVHDSSIDGDVTPSNAILRAAGYSDFGRRICLEVGLSDIHAVALDKAAMYETLCSGTTGAMFSVCDAGLQPITSISATRKNKERMLFSFFDEDQINGICAAYGLEFRHRVTINCTKHRNLRAECHVEVSSRISIRRKAEKGMSQTKQQ
ncbi:hypothetical protein DFQ28_001492, partial [Apophysomyces sp. BC1034]